MADHNINVFFKNQRKGSRATSSKSGTKKRMTIPSQVSTKASFGKGFGTSGAVGIALMAVKKLFSAYVSRIDSYSGKKSKQVRIQNLMAISKFKNPAKVIADTLDLENERFKSNAKIEFKQRQTNTNVYGLRKVGKKR